MNKPLPDAVREHLSRESLSEQQLQQLQALQQRYQKVDKTASEPIAVEHSQVSLGWGGKIAKNRWQFVSGSVAVIVLCLTSWLWLPINTGLPADITQRIAAEVVKNHLTMKPLEVTHNRVSGVRSYFTALDFSPVRSDIVSQKLRLLGGRYCSIQGNTAAQLRYQHAVVPGAQANVLTGNIGINNNVTLYQALYDAQVFGTIPDVDKGGEPLQIYEKGFSVRLWVEKDLLMVSVKAGQG